VVIAEEPVVSESNLLLILICIALFALFSGPIGRGSLTLPMALFAIKIGSMPCHNNYPL
jgi:hypothetical protein